MNDATRELGAALGIAVLGSLAASRYDGQVAKFLHGLSAKQRSTANTSIAGALRVAAKLPHHASLVLAAGAKGAFVSGLHFAALGGAVLALVRRGVRAPVPARTRSCPKARCAGPVESMEDMAEFGVSGGMPVFADSTNGDASDSLERRNDCGDWDRSSIRLAAEIRSHHQAPRYAAAAR